MKEETFGMGAGRDGIMAMNRRDSRMFWMEVANAVTSDPTCCPLLQCWAGNCLHRINCLYNLYPNVWITFLNVIEGRGGEGRLVYSPSKSFQC